MTMTPRERVLRAFKRAAARLGLGKSDIEAVFHGTARALIDRVGLELYGRAFMPTAAVSATATGDGI